MKFNGLTILLISVFSTAVWAQAPAPAPSRSPVSNEDLMAQLLAGINRNQINPQERCAEQRRECEQTLREGLAACRNLGLYAGNPRTPISERLENGRSRLYTTRGIEGCSQQLAQCVPMQSVARSLMPGGTRITQGSGVCAQYNSARLATTYTRLLDEARSQQRTAQNELETLQDSLEQAVDDQQKAEFQLAEELENARQELEEFRGTISSELSKIRGETQANFSKLEALMIELETKILALEKYQKPLIEAEYTQAVRAAEAECAKKAEEEVRRIQTLRNDLSRQGMLSIRGFGALLENASQDPTDALINEYDKRWENCRNQREHRDKIYAAAMKKAIELQKVEVELKAIAAQKQKVNDEMAEIKRSLTDEQKLKLEEFDRKRIAKENKVIMLTARMSYVRQMGISRIQRMQDRLIRAERNQRERDQDLNEAAMTVRSLGGPTAAAALADSRDELSTLISESRTAIRDAEGCQAVLDPRSPAFDECRVPGATGSRPPGSSH